MSLSTEYEAFRQAVACGYFSDEDPALCACHGGGWILSDFDTWHQCPCHHRPGMPHPEDHLEDEEVEFWATVEYQHMDHVWLWYVRKNYPEDVASTKWAVCGNCGKPATVQVGDMPPCCDDQTCFDIMLAKRFPEDDIPF